MNKSMVGTILFWLGACFGVGAILNALLKDIPSILTLIVAGFMVAGGLYIQNIFKTESWR